MKEKAMKAWMSSLAAVACTWAAQAQPPVAFDHGTYGIVPTTSTHVYNLPANTTVLWGKITLQLPINAADGSFIDIHTGADPAAPICQDTELGLYDASGALIATNDDLGTANRSLLSFGSTTARPVVGTLFAPTGQSGSSLAAGVYYIAVTSWNHDFLPNFNVPYIGQNIFGNVLLTINIGRQGSTTPPSAIDLGTVRGGRNPASTAALAVTGPQFYWAKFTTPQATDAANYYVDIHTFGSSLTNDGAGVNDTEIFLFDNAGAFVNSSDDFGSADPNASYLSVLSYGRTANARTYGGLANVAGQSGAVLAAGTYYVAVGGYNMGPGTAGWVVGQQNPSIIQTGTVKLTVETNFPPTADYDLGVIQALNSPARLTNVPIASGGVKWIKFKTLTATSAASIFVDIHTMGSDFPSQLNDTEIGLYDPLGNKLGDNDDWGGPANESGLSFGRTTGPRSYGTFTTSFVGQSGAVLPAGDYYLSVSGFNTNFARDFKATPVLPTASGNAVVSILTNAGTPLDYNLGEVSKRTGVYSSPSLPLPLAAVRWFRFTTAEATSASGKFLDMHTDGSSLSSTSITNRVDDTVLAFFDRTGTLIGSSDDWSNQANTGGTISNSWRSGLSYGNTTARSYGPVLGMAGQTGATLAAGEYYVAVAGFGAQSFSTPFTVTTASTFQGAVKLNIITNVNATPCSAADVAGQGGTSGADGILTADDVIVYLSAFLGGNLAVADIAQLGGAAGADGQLTADDLIFFLQRYFAGCI